MLDSGIARTFQDSITGREMARSNTGNRRSTAKRTMEAVGDLYASWIPNWRKLVMAQDAGLITASEYQAAWEFLEWRQDG